LIVVNVEALQRFRVVDFDLTPGDVVDPAGGFVDEVMMTIRVRIEEHRVGSEVQLPQQPFLHEEMKRVVDRRAGDHRKVLLHPRPHLVRRRMLDRLEYVLRNGNALRRRLNAVLLENANDVRLHIGNSRDKF